VRCCWARADVPTLVDRIRYFRESISEETVSFSDNDMADLVTRYAFFMIHYIG
jgi:hypothetical protein